MQAIFRAPLPRGPNEGAFLKKYTEKILEGGKTSSGEKKRFDHRTRLYLI